MLSYYEQKALLYAEKYGIITYDVKDNFMIWVEEFPIEGSYRYILNLDTMKTKSEKI